MPHLEAMDPTESMQFLLLNEDWHPIRRVNGNERWHDIIEELLLRDSQWLVIEQQRHEQHSPYPCWSDIRLSRAISRRLRPMDIRLADHVIRGCDHQFSFRAAGLL
jgi:hypothetical protein